jgi:hypothetical protein
MTSPERPPRVRYLHSRTTLALFLALPKLRCGWAKMQQMRWTGKLITCHLRTGQPHPFTLNSKFVRRTFISTATPAVRTLADLLFHLPANNMRRQLKSTFDCSSTWTSFCILEHKHSQCVRRMSAWLWQFQLGRLIATYLIVCFENGL